MGNELLVLDNYCNVTKTSLSFKREEVKRIKMKKGKYISYGNIGIFKL